MANNPSQQQPIQIQFKLEDVQEIQFATLVNEWPTTEQQVNNQLQFNVETDKRLVHCVAQYEYKQNDITQLILTVQSTFEFQTESWSAMYNLQGDEWLLPAGLLQHLADITIGASRGILAVRTQEKGFPRVILPLVNVAQIIQNNLRVPRKQG